MDIDDLDLLSVPEKPARISEPVSGPIVLPWVAVATVGIAALLLLFGGAALGSVVGYILAIVVATVIVGIYRASRARIRATDRNFAPSRSADFLATATLVLGFAVGLAHGWNMAFDISAWLATR